MARLKLSFLFLLFLFFPSLSHAQIYDVPCPAGTSPLQPYQTTNPANGHIKVFVCVDPTGSTTSPSLGNGAVGGSSIDPTQPPYNVKADVTKTGNDGTTTNTQNSFSSTNQSCAITDIGKLMLVIAPVTGAYPFGVGLVTVTSCNGLGWTLSTTSNTNLAGTAVWAIGSAGNGAGFLSAYETAIATNKTLVLPCGGIMIDTPPFFVPNSVSFAYLTNSFNLQGCNSGTGTRFILHPNFGLGTPNPLYFANVNLNNPITGSYTFQGEDTDMKVENLFITSMGGEIPCANGQTIAAINNYHNVFHIHIEPIAFSSPLCTFIGIQQPSGEANDGFNDFQFNSTGLGSQPTEIGISVGGQGQNAVHDSIFAWAPMIVMKCGTNSNCVLANNYITQVTNGAQSGGSGGFVTITGNELNVIGQCITDGGFQTTFYVFGNSQCGGTSVSTPAISLTNAASVMDISGTNVNNTTSGFSFTGTGTINDRAGNTFNGAFTQFTGTYIPVGGGSMAKQFTTAATNLGTAQGAQTIIPTVFYKTTLNIRIGARQVTLGIGCGAGANTAIPTLAWTAPSGTAETQVVTTLTVSANGAVDTGSVNYQTFTIPIQAGTAVTFTTASTLVSAGCSTVPQYAVETAIL